MAESPDHWQQYRLTPKERDVLLLLIEGLITREIAPRLQMRLMTVEQIRRSLYLKLDVSDFPSLLRKARSEGAQP